MDFNILFEMCVMKRTQLVTLVLCVSMVGWVIVVLTNFVSGVERKQNGKIREHIIDSYEKVTNTKRSNKSWSSSWSHGSILCCQINSWGRQVAMKYMMDLMLDLSYWGVLLHHVWLISSSGLAIRWRIIEETYSGKVDNFKTPVQWDICMLDHIYYHLVNNNNISSYWCPRSNLYIKWNRNN